jgi:hypothetical protein
MFLPKNSSVPRLQGLKAKGLLALGILVLAASSSAQVTKQGANYLLRVKYKPGQVLKYSTVSTMSGMQGAQPSKVNMPLVMKVGKVENAVANLNVTVGPVTLGGNELMGAQTMEMQVNNTNQAKSGKNSSLTGAQLPLKPIKVGQTWTNVAPVPDITGANKSMRATYKFQGLKTINGKSMAMISYTLSGGVSGSGTLYLLAADGTIYSNEAKVAYKSGSGNLNVSTLMKRV